MIQTVDFECLTTEFQDWSRVSTYLRDTKWRVFLHQDFLNYPLAHKFPSLNGVIWEAMET